MIIPVLASIAYGFMKGLSATGREKFHAEQDVYGPVKEEFIYRGVPLWTAPGLPFGATAVTFAADHVLSEMRQGNGAPMDPNDVAGRFGDVLLGGTLYEAAFRQFGIVGAAAAHIAHNMAVSWGTKARRKLK